MIARCPLCHRTCRHRFEINHSAIHRCPACDLEFVHPTPDPTTLSSVYSNDYFTHGAYDNYFITERDLARRKATQRLGVLRSLGAHHGQLIDLGCASGFFIDEALNHGFDAYGIEPSTAARAHATVRTAQRIALSLDSPTLPPHFDVITLWDVLEHLPDPFSTLASLRQRLRPSGWLALVVPTLGNVNTRLAPTTWDQYKPPEHLWYFSLRALTALLSQHDLDVVHHHPAWERHARWNLTPPLLRSSFRAVFNTVDTAVHRALSLVAGRHWVTDSIAVYAKARG